MDRAPPHPTAVYKRLTAWDCHLVADEPCQTGWKMSTACSDGSALTENDPLNAAVNDCD